MVFRCGCLLSFPIGPPVFLGSDCKVVLHSEPIDWFSGLSFSPRRYKGNFVLPRSWGFEMGLMALSL